MKINIKKISFQLIQVLIGISILVLLTQCILGGTPSSIPPNPFCITVATKIKHVNGYGSYKDGTYTDDNYDLFQYYVGNKGYDYLGLISIWAPTGEKYLLKYDILDSGVRYGHSHLIREHPVFLPGESTNYTYGTLIRVHPRNEVFEFEYTILGRKYERVQVLGIGNPVKNHPQLVNGAELLVEYWVENPQRAIIYIDKPKKDSLPFPVSPDIHVLRPVWDSIPVVLPNTELIKYQVGW
jgi:hypothetical protein